MQTYSDTHGLAFTASQPESVETFGALTRCYMGFRPETGDVLKSLLTADPDMPMALCAKGYFAKLFGSAGLAKRAAAATADLNQRLEKMAVTDRERRHAAALTAWTSGQHDQATRIWEGILIDHPMDGLALRLVHFMHFYSGDGRRIRDSMARTLPLWPEDHPEYGFLQGMYAFGLEEAGEYAKAETYGRMAVERNPQDAWSVHAVAHVMEMTGRHHDGIDWVRGLEQDWSTVNNFRFHLYWHQCLYHLELGAFDEVFRIYDDQIVSDIESEFYLDICNASALLRRLEMFGQDVGDRWQKLAEVARTHIDDQELIFVTLHYLMALIYGGDAKSADAMIDSIKAWAAEDGTQSKVCRDSGIAVAEAMRMDKAGDYAGAIKAIDQVRYGMDPMGGSMAQRDVFQMILMNAVRETGDHHTMRALFAERVQQKPTSSWSWTGYADALDALGDGQATAARAKAQAILAQA